MLEANNSKLTITATDLDLIFINEIKDIEIQEEGKTTTTSSILYDIVRKFSSGKKINFFNLGPKNNWKNQLKIEIQNKLEDKFRKEMLELGYI